jgi:orotate phosphoribosyltransferase
VNRFEGARELLASENVKLHEVTDIVSISSTLHDAKLLDNQTFQRIKNK